MLLPYGKRAIVDIRKLRNYCLSPDNPRGRHKARVFAAVLGLKTSDGTSLRLKLLEIARTGEAVPAELDLYGQRYTIDFEIETKAGKGTIRSCWIILRGKRIPRLTTCYVKRRRR